MNSSSYDGAEIWHQTILKHYVESFRRCAETPEIATFADISIVLLTISRCIERYPEIDSILSNVNDLINRQHSLIPLHQENDVEGVFEGKLNNGRVLCEITSLGQQGKIFLDETYFVDSEFSIGDFFRISKGELKARRVMRHPALSDAENSSENQSDIFRQAQDDWLWAYDNANREALENVKGEYVAIVDKKIIAGSDDDVGLREEVSKSQNVPSD